MNNKNFSFSKRIYSKKTIDMVTNKVKLLGIDNNIEPIYLLNIRLFSSFLIFFVLLYFVDFGYLVAPLVTFLFYILFFRMVLDTKIERRRKTLEQEALYFFEILALSLESGKNIKSAIEVATSSVDSLLSREFKKVLQDVSYGKSLDWALNDLKYRIPSDSINNIILNIKEANVFGNNVVDTIYNQIEYLRGKRLMEAKAVINKIPVKISVVSVIFFIPLLLLLLLGPVIVNLIS